jgi:hypothetical protein
VILKDNLMVLDTTATRRGTYLIKRPATSDDPEKWVMVAEPPPDAAMATALQAAIDADMKTQSATGSINLSQTITQLTQTQTVLVTRDTLFRISEAYANGAIDKTEYQKEFSSIVDLVKTLANTQEQNAQKAATKAESASKILSDPKLTPDQKTLQLQSIQ